MLEVKVTTPLSTRYNVPVKLGIASGRMQHYLMVNPGNFISKNIILTKFCHLLYGSGNNTCCLPDKVTTTHREVTNRK